MKLIDIILKLINGISACVSLTIFLLTGNIKLGILGLWCLIVFINWDKLNASKSTN